MLERVNSVEEARQALAEARRERAVTALVPTMGALHEGHLSLVRAATSRADHVSVSVFVNPTQFGPGEDFDSYPRDLDRDLELLSEEGVDLVFVPSVAEMYAAGDATTVDPGPLGKRWEGESRPGHFVGVSTVVTKLLGIFRPDIAVFGEKDYQQLLVVRAIAADLKCAASIVACPIVRDGDGLAISSRHAYMSPDERAAAAVVYRALATARDAAGSAGGPRDLEELMRDVVGTEPLASLDYAAVVDPATLEPAISLDDPTRGLIALRVGRTRLIDNEHIPASRGTS